MEPEVIGALIGVPGVTVFGWLMWRLGVRQADSTAEEQAMTHFRWAVEQINSGTTTGISAGYVALQTLSTNPYLSAANRRMIEATTIKLRAITGGTP